MCHSLWIGNGYGVEIGNKKAHTNWRLNWNGIMALIAVFVMLSCVQNAFPLLQQQVKYITVYSQSTSGALKFHCFILSSSILQNEGFQFSTSHFFLSSAPSPIIVIVAVRSRNCSQLSSFFNEKLLAVRMFC